ILTALALSISSGVPLPAAVLAINIALLAIGLVLSIALARDRVPLRFAHPISAVIWLLAPSTTLASYLATHQATLVLPLIIGVATAALAVAEAVLGGMFSSRLMQEVRVTISF
ncbi:MAG: hypothetical protein ABJE66_30350, partial [Deltaproteobacteria bacterium]